MPFCKSAHTASHDTEMLVELVSRPLTFCGAPSGSDKPDDSNFDTEVYRLYHLR